MKFHSAKSLVTSRRNLALRGASYCNHCGILVPDDFQEVHLKECNERKEAQVLCL